VPRGYSGAPARRYFLSCEDGMSEAHQSIEAASAIMTTIPRSRLWTLPFVEADAVFTPGVTAGAENSTNIVASRWHYTALANEQRLFCECIIRDLHQIYDEIDGVVDVDLRLPQTSAQVKFVTQTLRSILPDFKGLLEQTEHVTKRQADSMLSIAGGGFDGFELHRQTAESCQTENEQCMRSQALDIRDYARRAREQAEHFDARADARRPDLSAVIVRWDRYGSWTAPNEPVRAAARADITRYEGFARAYRGEANKLERAAVDLDNEIRRAFQIFQTDCDECIACDTYYAGEFRRITDDMLRHVGMIRSIRDSFCPTAGILNFSALATANSMSMQEMQDILLRLEAEVAMRQMMPNGEANWDLIEERLGRSHEYWRTADEIALTAIFMSLNGSENLERFLNAMGESFGLGGPWDIWNVPRRERNNIGDTLWRFCPNKANSIRQNMENSIALLLAHEMASSNNNDDDVAGNIREFRHQMQQRGALLSTVGNLTVMQELGAVGRLFGGIDNRFSPIQNGFIVLGAADSPSLSVEQLHNGDFRLSFERMNKDLNGGPMGESLIIDQTVRVPGHSHDRMRLTNLHTETITVSSVENGRSAANRLVQLGASEQLQRHQFDIHGHLNDATISIVIGAIPKVGSFLGAADALNPLGTLGAQTAARDSINAMRRIAEHGIDIAAFDLDVVFVTSENDLSSHLIWPSQNTANRVEEVLGR